MQRTERSTLYAESDLDEENRPTVCPNCGAERQGPYCHECGQRYLRARLSAWELWWIFADRFLDWEEGVWRTFLQMMVAPGVVIRHYLDGRRRTYLNPFSYLLFCMALYALGQFVMGKVAGLAALPGFQKMQELGMALNNAEDQFTGLAYGTAFIVAVLALAMRVMFDGQLLSAMEAVVTTIYTAGNVVLLILGVSIIEFVLSGDPLSTWSTIWVFALLFPFCMGHAGYGLFEDWGMAGYSGIAPVMAFFIGGGLVFLGAGLLGGISRVVANMAAGKQGAFTTLAFTIVATLFLFAPALAPFLVDKFS